MTENEAIERIRSGICNEIGTQRFCRDSCMYGIDKCAYSMAIQALTEIQQYRAIGTVEDIQLIFSLCKDLQDVIKQYERIGTIEEFKALKEKSVAKKPIKNNPQINEFYVKEANLCPSCHSYINNCSGDYCRDCAQKLDWND